MSEGGGHHGQHLQVSYTCKFDVVGEVQHFGDEQFGSVGTFGHE